MTKTIVDIQVVDVEKRRVPSKHYVYVIVVKWTDNSSMVVYRRYSRFFDLQTQLLDKFPIEAGTTDPSLRIIPFLPGKIFFGRSQVRDVAMKRLGEIDTYCKNLLALPPHISQCEEVLEFFEVEPDDLDPPKEDPNERRFSLNMLGKQKAEKKAEKISGPKQLEQFMAVADYSAQEKGEMDLHAGMAVEVTEKSESGWWFVNAEEHQGWVPSTYLQSVNGLAASHNSVACAVDGQEEKYICIETFTAANSDEISLEKGVIVEVRQKNMDGWWIVKYQGAEGFAPATYLKKSTDPYAQALVEKSRQSGVQIISNLSDVSNLMTSSSSPRNSAILSSSPRSTSMLANIAQAGKNAGDERESGNEDEEEMDVVLDNMLKAKSEPLSKVVLKQRSLERGGSLKPPPRQNSVKQMVVSSPPPTSPTRTSTYITIAEFEDTVGDGISFGAGENVTVLEKTSSGWWFVERGHDQGWVPESFLEQAGKPSGNDHPCAGSDSREEDSDKEEEEAEDDEEEQTQPPSASLASALSSRLKGVNGHQNTSVSSAAGPPKLPGKVTSKPPPLPGKPQDQSKSENYQEQSRDTAVVSPKDKEATSGIANALKSRFESKPPGLPSKPTEKPGPPPPPSKPSVSPAAPNKPSGPLALPKKPSSAPAPPSKSNDKPEPPGFFSKPKPPGLPNKPAEKPGLSSLPKKPERAEGSGAPGGTVGLASSLKSMFESQQQEDKPAKPVGKPSLQFSKPAPPSKSFARSGGDSHHGPSFPNKMGGEGRPFSNQKPSLPFKNNSAIGDVIKPSSVASKGSSGPPKLLFKPQVGSKPSSDSNNNTGGVSRPASSKVHSMAAVFGKQDETSNNSKPTLPVKKPALPHPPAQKSNNRDSDIPTGKPRVGNLVNELSSKLQFGGGGGGLGGDSKSPEPSPVTKTGPWSAQPKDSSKASESLPSTHFSQQKSSFQASILKPQAAAPGGGVEYEAVADFAAEGAGELSLQCGDVVEVLNQQQEDWWLVKLHNDQGWVPSSYLAPGPEWDD